MARRRVDVKTYCGAHCRTGDRGVPAFVRTMLSIGEEGGRPFSSLFGGSHVLFFVEESGGFGGFTALEFVVNRRGIIRRYDLVGQGNRLYELKNVAELSTEAVDQLVSDLRIPSDKELRSLTWVFRGTESQLPFNTSNVLVRVESRIISQFEDPLRSDLLRRIDPMVGAFGPTNIRFTGGSRPFP